MERVIHIAGFPRPNPMAGPELLDRCDASLRDFCRTLAQRAPHGEVLDEDGLFLYTCGHPSPVIVNGAIRTDAGVRPEAVLSRAAAFFGKRGYGYGICVRAHGDGDLEQATRGAPGMEPFELAEMILEAPLPPPALARGARLARVEAPATLEDFVRVTEAVYEDEPALRGMARAAFADLGSLAAPNSAGIVAYLGGKPASAAMIHVNRGVGLVGCVGTVEGARRHGLGEAVTCAVTNAGFDMGAAFVHLQASPMGLPVYAKMGFREISRYRLYERNP